MLTHRIDAALAEATTALSRYPRPIPTARRFPPPWTIEEHNNACFIVKDAIGQTLGYFYFEDEPGRRSAAKLLTRTRPDGGGETRQAAGAGARDVAEKRSVRRCNRHASRQSAQCPLIVQLRKYRCIAASDVMGQ